MFSKICLLVLLMFALGCTQTWLPGSLVWDYDYDENMPPENDSLNIVFDVFYMPFVTDTNIVQLDSTSTHKIRLLTYEELYQNRTLHFYVRARSLADGSLSLNSDTVNAYFPKIITGKPYQISILETKLP